MGFISDDFKKRHTQKEAPIIRKKEGAIEEKKDKNKSDKTDSVNVPEK
jgi:hypothetical protein